MNLLNKN